MLSIYGSNGVKKVPPLISIVCRLFPTLFSGGAPEELVHVFFSVKASSTFQTAVLMPLCGTLHAYSMFLHLVPEALCRKVSATVSHGSRLGRTKALEVKGVSFIPIAFPAPVIHMDRHGPAAWPTLCRSVQSAKNI